MMDILLLVIGAVIGVAVYALAPVAYRRIRPSADTSPTNYDTRIDQISESGLVRYELHKAHRTPSLRAALKGSDLYAEAAPVLGWDD